MGHARGVYCVSRDQTELEVAVETCDQLWGWPAAFSPIGRRVARWRRTDGADGEYSTHPRHFCIRNAASIVDEPRCRKQLRSLVLRAP